MKDHLSGAAEYTVNINGVDVTARYSERAVRDIFIPLLKKLKTLQAEKGSRVLVMLAAPPGAGKSTLLSFLEKMSVEREDLAPVQVIGMDGFHRRQEYLLSHEVERDGQRIKMVEIKGAPVTFDLEKLTERVRRVASGENCGWPLYNRMLHNPVEDALRVEGGLVILEGNYLLLDEDGWRELSQYADYTISVRADEELLRARLIDRRIKTGVDAERATKFVDFSDMPNVRVCLEKTMTADLRLRIGPDDDYYLCE